MYEYFISYVFQDQNGVGFGSRAVGFNDPITSIDQVRTYETQLRREGFTNASVLGFTRFGASENR
jgi:hypothetical protein